MTIENIREIVKEKENTTLEFKEYKKALDPDIYETVCSFANHDGGNIFIGVNDKTHEITGVPKEIVDKLKIDFLNGVSNPNKISPKLLYELSDIEVDGKIILYTTIYPSPSVHKLNGNRIFDRIDETDKDITDTPDLVANLYLRKKQTYSENDIYPYCRMDQLREDLINKARILANNNDKNHNHPWATMDNMELLRSAGLYLEDPLTGKKGFTLGCILLFGKDETIMAVCPQHRTDCLKRVKNLDRYDDRDDIRTNLIESYDRMMAFIAKHLDSGFAIGEDTRRYSPRDLLFREAVANSLIHREFRDRTTATMVIEKDKVVFTNGCISLGRGILKVGSFSPKSKNPRIAAVFHNMGLADELGSGVRNMFAYNKVYSNAEPIIKEGDVFEITIPLVSKEIVAATNDKYNKMIIKYIEENGSINNEQCRELTGYERTKSAELLSNLVLAGIIVRSGSGKSTYYILKK